MSEELLKSHESLSCLVALLLVHFYISFGSILILNVPLKLAS